MVIILIFFFQIYLGLGNKNFIYFFFLFLKKIVVIDGFDVPTRRFEIFGICIIRYI